MVVSIERHPRGLRFSLSPREPYGGQSQLGEPSVFFLSARYVQLSSFHVNYVSFSIPLGTINDISLVIYTLNIHTPI